jgi:hypothetical protein
LRELSETLRCAQGDRKAGRKGNKVYNFCSEGKDCRPIQEFFEKVGDCRYGQLLEGEKEKYSAGTRGAQ